MVIQLLIFSGTSILFSTVVAPIDILTNIIKEFSKCLHLIILLCPGDRARQSTFQIIVVVKTLNIRSTLLNILAHNTVLLNTGTMLHSRSLEFIHLA